MDSFIDYDARIPAEMFDLTGKTVLVLGGSSGIGLGLAAGLGMAGADLILNGRSAAKLASAEGWLRSKNVRVRTLACSITDAGFTAAIDTMLAEARLDLGGVVFSAAAFHLQPFLDYERSKIDDIIQMNLIAPITIAQWAARRMKRTGGSLLFVSSSAALRAMPTNAVYAATKGALLSLTKTLAVELAPHEIRVNCLVPGWVDTPMTAFTRVPAPALPDKPLPAETIRRSIPQKRWGLPKDFAAVGVWLMSEASSYVTGQEFLIDGGMLAK